MLCHVVLLQWPAVLGTLLPQFGRGRDNWEEHAVQIKASERSVHLTAVDIERDHWNSQVQSAPNHVSLLN